ncbi:MAG: hypothetical protein P1V20_20930 [Verrucomicrobiales bacterium]|nr:hypothetical protein [Verrucomicrobiales bacterium]
MVGVPHVEYKVPIDFDIDSDDEEKQYTGTYFTIGIHSCLDQLFHRIEVAREGRLNKLVAFLHSKKLTHGMNRCKRMVSGLCVGITRKSR